MLRHQSRRARNFIKLVIVKEAIKYYDSAIKLDSTNYGGFFSRGLCYKDMGLLDAELDDYNTAIHLSPMSDRKTLYYTRGEIKHLLNMSDEACQDMRIAKKMGSRDANIYVNAYCTN